MNDTRERFNELFGATAYNWFSENVMKLNAQTRVHVVKVKGEPFPYVHVMKTTEKQNPYRTSVETVEHLYHEYLLNGVYAHIATNPADNAVYIQIKEPEVTE